MMRTPKEPKSKADYNLIQVHVRGDSNFVNQMKAEAALANMPLADYLRWKLEQKNFTQRGKKSNQSGKND